MESFIYGHEDALNVLIQPVDDHDLAGMENEVQAIRKLTDADFCLVAVKVNRWNHDLSPWPAPAVFGNECFGNGAAPMLDRILEECTEKDRSYYIGGYSLAGLFSLWAGYQTERFSGVAAASPSVWFPNFVEYMRTYRIRTGTVYLSLGDREEKTRNQVMAAVGGCIREAYDLFQEQGIKSILEWNPGNHFKDADLRTARAFAWLLNETKGKR